MIVHECLKKEKNQCEAFGKLGMGFFVYTSK